MCLGLGETRAMLPSKELVPGTATEAQAACRAPAVLRSQRLERRAACASLAKPARCGRWRWRGASSGCLEALLAALRLALAECKALRVVVK